ncbi:MAG: hypothetical protein M1428_04680 [Deltaproteobacteria bacterium]|nr:hypothetical protein [Deltaproteobacteria bacterium]
MKPTIEELNEKLKKANKLLTESAELIQDLNFTKETNLQKIADAAHLINQIINDISKDYPEFRPGPFTYTERDRELSYFTYIHRRGIVHTQHGFTFSPEGLSITDLKWVIKYEDSPAFAREAAIKLYELGQKDYAMDFLIKQMNQYKDPKTHKNIIRETCPHTAKALGELGDKRAIEPLLEALGKLGYEAAYGLAKIDGPDVEQRLLKLAESDDTKGIYAAVALGYMKNKFIVPRLIDILDHADEYKQKIKDMWINFIKLYIKPILGTYKDNEEAEKAFLKYLTDSDISYILFLYLHQEQYNKHELEWEIVTKYKWTDYLTTDEEIYAIRYGDALEKDMKLLRDKIIRQIRENLPSIKSETNQENG